MSHAILALVSQRWTDSHSPVHACECAELNEAQSYMGCRERTFAAAEVLSAPSLHHEWHLECSYWTLL